jgi:hypothetical protein
MTNLHDLVDAMGSPPDFAAQPIDLPAVMAAGGRVRRRRRFAVVAASGLAVAALLIGGTQLAGRAAPTVGGGPAQTAAQPTTPPTTRPTTKPALDGKVLGDIVHTGVSAKGDEWLLYAQAIDDKAIPKTHFGIMLGRRAGDGTLIDAVMANETEGSGRSAGFHAVEGAMNVDGYKTMTFGYYVGPAKKITGKAHGKTLTARQATWSEDSSVQIFWFATTTEGIGKLTALDKNGRKLPAGNNSPGVG